MGLYFTFYKVLTLSFVFLLDFAFIYYLVHSIKAMYQAVENLKFLPNLKTTN